MFKRNKTGKINDKNMLPKGSLSGDEIDNSKAQSAQSVSAKKRKKSDKPKISKRIAKTFKEMFSELKKVTWTPFRKALVQTGVVLVVVLLFLVVIGAFDSGLAALIKLATK